MTSSFFLILEVCDKSEFFEASGPGVCPATLMKAFDRSLVFMLGNVQKILGDAPHAATERLALLYGNHVAGTIFPATLAQDSPVKGKLVTVAITSEVTFEPAQIVTGFQVNNTELRVVEIHADLAGFAFIVGSYHAFGSPFTQKFSGFFVVPDGSQKFGNENKIFS
jgi:hypothetical protein